MALPDGVYLVLGPSDGADPSGHGCGYGVGTDLTPETPSDSYHKVEITDPCEDDATHWAWIALGGHRLRIALCDEHARVVDA